MSTPVLLADIGGTHIRLALSSDSDAPLQCAKTLHCADFAQPLDAVRQYLDFLAQDGAPLPHSFCMAVAAPVQGDEIHLTNNHWQFSQSALSQSLQMSIDVLNDFEAQAWCLMHPDKLDLHWINRSNVVWPEALRTIAGAGTGFGSASLSSAGEVISSEPGHIAFAPLDEDDYQILHQLWTWFPRVTAEHLISGPGIANIYCALANLAGETLTPVTAPSAAEIVEMADSSRLARESLQYFSRSLGAICGDLALAKGSRGGFFLSGGLIRKLGAHFDEAAFLRAFTNKATFSPWCTSIPLAYVKDEFPGLTGCSVYVHHKARQQTSRQAAAR